MDFKFENSVNTLQRGNFIIPLPIFDFFVWIRKPNFVLSLHSLNKNKNVWEQLSVAAQTGF
jgi:hypothetical protein